MSLACLTLSLKPITFEGRMTAGSSAGQVQSRVLEESETEMLCAVFSLEWDFGICSETSSVWNLSPQCFLLNTIFRLCVVNHILVGKVGRNHQTAERERRLKYMTANLRNADGMSFPGLCSSLGFACWSAFMASWLLYFRHEESNSSRLIKDNPSFWFITQKTYLRQRITSAYKILFVFAQKMLLLPQK